MSTTTQAKGHQPDVVHRCRTCEDTGWVEIERADWRMPKVDMPCRTCNPIMHRRWMNGCLTGPLCPCSECVGIRSGMVKSFDYLPNGELRPGTVD